MSEWRGKPMLAPLTECARCRVRPPLHPYTGCLCGECEDAIEGMTQAELDADYEAHTEGNDLK
jgi:hypothetical protein